MLSLLFSRQKHDTWKRIAQLFNQESNETFRTASTLKMKYENIKKDIKGEISDDKIYRKGTGGGEERKSKLEMNETTAQVLSMLGDTVAGEQSKLDDDLYLDGKE